MAAIAKFRRQLQAGKILLGPSISLTDPLVTDALADSVDFVWIDTEHTLMNPPTFIGHLLAARTHDLPVVVRIPGSATHLIKPVLDSGVEGLVVPQVRSAEEVRSIVADCRYPPLGRRGIGPRVLANYGRKAVAEFARETNESMFVSAQIENTEGLAALDDILAVPGLDSVVIGPVDLSASLGVLGEIEHPMVLAAISTICTKARAAGIFVGAGCGNAQYASLLIQHGVQWVQMGGDDGFLWRYFELMTAEVRARIGSQTS
jgi:2-keto-3-deoxy-L-rhamnonate aldolase RhmA